MGTGVEDEISPMQSLTKGYSVQRNLNNQMDRMAHSTDVETSLTIACSCNGFINNENLMAKMKVIHGLNHMDFPQPT